MSELLYRKILVICTVAVFTSPISLALSCVDISLVDPAHSHHSGSSTGTSVFVYSAVQRYAAQ